MALSRIRLVQPPCLVYLVPPSHSERPVRWFLGPTLGIDGKGLASLRSSVPARGKPVCLFLLGIFILQSVPSKDSPRPPTHPTLDVAFSLPLGLEFSCSLPTHHLPTHTDTHRHTHTDTPSVLGRSTPSNTGSCGHTRKLVVRAYWMQPRVPPHTFTFMHAQHGQSHASLPYQLHQPWHVCCLLRKNSAGRAEEREASVAVLFCLPCAVCWVRKVYPFLHATTHTSLFLTSSFDIGSSPIGLGFKSWETHCRWLRRPWPDLFSSLLLLLLTSAACTYPAGTTALPAFLDACRRLVGRPPNRVSRHWRP